jgi:hypothetical protein
LAIAGATVPQIATFTGHSAQGRRSEALEKLSALIGRILTPQAGNILYLKPASA